MTDNLVICKKLEVLVTYYQGLAELTTGLTQEEYQRNLLIRRAIEREIQLMVECATDINNIILKKLQGAPAKDYFNSFIDLAENEVIDMDFPLAIAPSTGLRNILVHEYQRIDDQIVFASIASVRDYYRKYIAKVAEYLDCNIELSS